MNDTDYDVRDANLVALDEMIARMTALHEIIVKRENRLRALEKALAVYADPTNWIDKTWIFNEPPYTLAQAMVGDGSKDSLRQV